MTKRTKEDKARAFKHLSHLKPGDTLYTIHRHATRSGWSSYYDVYHIVEIDSGKFVDADPALERLTWSIACLAGLTYDHRREAIKIEGMNFSKPDEIAQRLAFALWPDGFGPEQSKRYHACFRVERL